MLSFKAHCARNHDRIDFTDPQAFESHMVTEHSAKRYRPGGAAPSTCDRKAPGWEDGKPSRPYAWKAPRPERDGLAKVAERMLAGEYGSSQALLQAEQMGIKAA